jgi:hypothetical protein
MPATLARCPWCGGWANDGEFAGVPRPPSEEVRATDFLVPRNVSAASLFACYLGLIGFCLPFIGLVFAIPAVILGVVGLKRQKKASSYGSVTSDIRAVIGIILGGLGILVWGGLGAWMLINGALTGPLAKEFFK